MCISYISLFADRPTGSSLSNRPVPQHCYMAHREMLGNCHGESRHARRPGEHLDAKVLVRGYRCITMRDVRVVLHGCLTARLMYPSGSTDARSLYCRRISRTSQLVSAVLLRYYIELYAPFVALSASVHYPNEKMYRIEKSLCNGYF